MILVTGGTGLVGSHLLLELVKKNHTVHAFRRSSSNIINVLRTFGYYSDNPDELYTGIKWIEADLTDFYSIYDAIEGIEEVYHTAAAVSFDSKDKGMLMKNNVEGTANLVNACLERKIKKLCYVSSTSVIGSVPSGELATEDMVWTPSKNQSLYSVSKFKSEMEVWRGIAEGLNAVIVNPSVIIGPGNWDRSSSMLFSTIWKGLRYYTEGVSGYVDVRDVVKAMIQLMESDISGERFLVTSDNLSFREVFEMIAKALEKKPPRIRATPFMTGLAWRGDWLKSKLVGSKRQITKEIAQAGVKKAYFSNQKIKDTLNFEFIPVEQSIKETAECFLRDIGSKKELESKIKTG